jgi:hypothetical protein
VEEEVELRHTLDLLAAEGPGAPAPVVAAPPAAPSLPEFAAFKAALEKRCWVQARGGSTPAVKGAAAEKANCLRRAFVAELDRVLVPLEAREPARFQALMGEQAGWNRLVEKACPFFDETAFLDLQAGAWSFGTIYGLAGTMCEQESSAERAFYAAALRLEEWARLAARVRDADQAARPVRAKLSDLRRGLAALDPTSAPADHRSRATAEDIRRLLATAAAIEQESRALGEASCANWPELARALGGPSACAAAMESYYLQHW